MNEERWYPALDGPQVVGRFEWYDKLMIADSIAADEKKYLKIIVLRHKVIGSTDEDTTPLKDHNREALKARFPAAWQAFQGEIPAVSGVLLSDPSVTLEGMNAARVEQFKIIGILTLEQLAGLSDAQCQSSGFGTRTLRGFAQKLIGERTNADNAAARAFVAQQMAPAAEPKKNKGGRPTGSKNRPKADQAATH